MSLLESIAAVLVDRRSLVQQNRDGSGCLIVGRSGDGTADQRAEERTHDLGGGIQEIRRVNESE